VLGEVPSQARRRQTILQALRQPLIEALGEDIDEAFLIDHRTVATARPARWLDVALRDADAASRLDLRPAQPASAPAGDGASARCAARTCAQPRGAPTHRHRRAARAGPACAGA
jgi:cobaltochelatase CobN